MIPSGISPPITPAKPPRLGTKTKALVLLMKTLTLSPLGLADNPPAAQANTQPVHIPTPEQPGAIPLREPLAKAYP